MNARAFGQLMAAAAISIALTPSVAVAENVVGLFIDVKGVIQPSVTPFSEVEAGRRFELARDAEATVAHYASCVEMRLRGGSILFADLEIESTGKRIFEAMGACPSKVSFAQSGNPTAGVVLRGVPPTNLIAERPRFVVAGGRVAEVVVRRRTVDIRRLGFANGAASWPRDAPSLRPGDGYEIAIFGPGGEEQTAAVAVEADIGVTVLQP